MMMMSTAAAMTNAHSDYLCTNFNLTTTIKLFLLFFLASNKNLHNNKKKTFFSPLFILSLVFEAELEIINIIRK